MTEDDTFNALRRAPFNDIYQDLLTYIDDDNASDDLRPILDKHRWNIHEYIKAGWDKLYTEYQEDNVIEDHVRLVQQISEMFPTLYPMPNEIHSELM